MKTIKTVIALAVAAGLGAGATMWLDRDDTPEVIAADTSTQAVADLEGQARKGAYKDDFAALNARRDGVVTLPSGVQYEILSAGSGETPQPGDAVQLHYTGSLTDGRVFDSTANAGGPLTIDLDAIAIPGLREALLLMPEGSHWRVVIPPSQGFANAGNNRLRRRDLVYDIELVGIDG